MKDKDAATIKVLVDIGYTKSPELTPEQEEHLERALDPEKQFLHDVERLFNPQIQEDGWDDGMDDDERRRTTPNPLPVADSEILNHVFDLSEKLDDKILAYYKSRGKKPNGLREIGELLKQGRREYGSIEAVSVSNIVASEDMLDGGHLDALTNKQQTTSPSGDVVLLKYQGKYYTQDGNHRIAAAAARGDKQIKALVLDMDSI